MSLFEINYRSAALNHHTFINVILPDGGPSEDIPTLYLLHGMHSDYTGWLRKTNIERYAQERGIAVVMPNGENGFYNDMKYGKKHFTYIADELVEYTRKVFRLSTKREKTYIAGFSMGGYGAFLLGLRRPEQYAACASLSGCVDIVQRLQTCGWTDEARAIWGEDFKTCVKGTESDLKWLVENFPAEASKPRMYSACGRQDSLFADNVRFAEFMENKGFDFCFEKGDGEHNWEYWDKWIVPALDHMIKG